MAKIYDDSHSAKDEWAKLKNEPLKVKIQYFFNYYGTTTLAIIIAIAVIVSLVTSIIDNSIPVVIAGTFCSDDVTTDPEEEVKQALCAAMGLNPSSYHIELSNSYVNASDSEAVLAIQQKMVARVVAADLDFAVGIERFFTNYLDKDAPEDGIFADLSAVLSPEVYQALLDAGMIQCFEGSKSSFPCMIDLTDTKLASMYKLSGKRYFGVVVTTKNIAAVETFIRLYILK